MPRLVLLVLLAVFGFGCAGPAFETAAQDQVSYELFRNTLALEAGDLGGLRAESTPGTLVFEPAPAALGEVAPGRVIVAPRSATAPKGLLRIVVSASRSGDRLTLQTIDAPLQLAFKKLHAALAPRRTPKLSESVSQTLKASPLSVGDGASDSLAITLPAFDGDNDLSTVDDQVKAAGYIGGGFDYVFGIDTDWGDIDGLEEKIEDCIAEVLKGSSCSIASLIPKVEVGYHVKGNADAKLELAGTAYKGYTRDYEILNVALEPIEIGVLVFFPHVVVTGKVEGKASSRFAVGIEAHAAFEAGVSYSNESGASGSPMPEASATVTGETPEVTLYANAKASVDVSVHIKLYDVLGPRAGVELGAEIDADQERSPCFELRSKLAASYGFVIGVDFEEVGLVELADFGDTLPLHDEVVASGACTLPAEPAAGAPGSGPTNETLLNPKFSPWVRAFGGAVTAFPSVHADGMSFADLERTIDGRFALTSSASSAIVKLDETGNPIWTRRYELFAKDELLFDPTLEGTRVLRVTDTPDAGLLAITYPYGLVKLGQGGDVAWAESFDLPRRSSTGPFGNYAHQQTFVAIASDGGKGHFVLGTLQAADGALVQGWLLHVDQLGQVLSSQTLSDPAASIYPTVLLAHAGGLFVAGYLHTPGSVTLTGFWLMLDGTGQPKLGRKNPGCGDFIRAIPTAGLVNKAGDVVLVGRDATQERGFVARIKQNGEAGFFTRPWTGTELEDFALHSIVELPTGGYLVAGRHVTTKPAARVLVAALDVVGKPLWARAYAPTSGEATFPALRLTDDGGAMLVAFSGQPGTAGETWAMKLPAKNGDIGFGPEASNETLVLTDDACAPVQQEFAPAVESVATPSPTPRSVKAEPVVLEDPS